jgi:protein gp37
MEGKWDKAPKQYHRVFEEVTFIPGRVAMPLHWRTPRAVFVNSVSDIFHEAVSFEEIAAIFAVMGACPRHIFILLTKRHERMVRFYEGLAEDEHPYVTLVDCAWEHLVGKERDTVQAALVSKERTPWPFPNVIVGVSVENQETAALRTAAVLKVPAAVRFVSYEPGLGGVDFTRLRGPELDYYNSLDSSCRPGGGACVDWIVVGGESGPDARPFDIDYARSTIAQCREADTRCFVKQLGANPIETDDGREDTGFRVALRDPKGGDPSEWPDGLNVREFPVVETAKESR